MGIRFPAGDWNRYQPAKMVLSQIGEEMAPKDKWWLALRSGSSAMTMWLPSWQGSSSSTMEGSVVVVVLVVDLLQLKFTEWSVQSVRKSYEFKTLFARVVIPWIREFRGNYAVCTMVNVVGFYFSMANWGTNSTNIVRAARGHIDKFNYILV